MYLHGGYKTHRVLQIGNLLSAFRSEKVSLRALRLYLAALVIVAAREAAKRSRPHEHGKRNVTPRYLQEELARLTGCPLRRVRGELRSLERAGLLLFSETEITFTETPLPGADSLIEMLSGSRTPARPVPLPRPILRYLARCRRPGTILTTLCYCIRGLSLGRGGELRERGTAKASWIAEVTGQTVRSVRNARAELLELGLISDDEGSKQWKLNRDGAYFTVNLAWTGPKPVDSSLPPCTEFSLPTAGNGPNFSPPYEDMKTPIGFQTPETRHAESSGVCKANEERNSARRDIFRTNSVKNPTLKAIRVEDLRRLSSIRALFQQANSAGWIDTGEASFLNFVGAAVRATRIQSRDPVRVFVTIVRRKLWHHITQEQELRAREVIRREQVKQQSSGRRSLAEFAGVSCEGIVSEMIKSIGQKVQSP